MRRNPFNRRRGAPLPVAARSRRGHSYVLSRPERLEDRIAPALGTFQLDGNAITQVTTPPGHDWDQVYNDAVLNPGQNTSGSIPGAVVFLRDPANAGNTDDVFTQGSKDTQDVNQWTWTTSSAQDKADIADAYAAAYQVQVGAETHTIINFGTDRISNSGSTTLGFWFFQNPISKNANGTFSGNHEVGDIFVVADFAGAVGTIEVFKWIGNVSGGPLQLLTNTDASNLFARVNLSATPSGGWPFQDKGVPLPTPSPLGSSSRGAST